MQTEEDHAKRVAGALSVQENERHGLELSLLERGCVLGAGQQLEGGQHVEQVEPEDSDHRQPGKRHHKRERPADRAEEHIEHRGQGDFDNEHDQVAGETGAEQGLGGDDVVGGRRDVAGTKRRWRTKNSANGAMIATITQMSPATLA